MHSSEILNKFCHGSNLPRFAGQVFRIVQRLFGVADKDGHGSFYFHYRVAECVLLFDVNAGGLVFAHSLSVFKINNIF